ncbi:hypothetical protein EDD69_109103 [Thermolongibacillus altinsuensis]|uniref:Uncharacterized protein n=1 Tax=Thermolongibacillus altinsuensis TaxID=575256 RepID=A0A4R1QCR4_9BACL|nr:hypothetical protein [Thermolongibacillus altinsuensis]TCL48473.1 hypothetical protein EDD69_109103 [Thermolongibacillus altinsuensis]
MDKLLNIVVPTFIIITSVIGLVYIIRREKRYCLNCNCKLLELYVDRNKKVFTEGELEAFKILHPEDRSKFRKIKYCRQCQKVYK